jgi:TusA-related sulfurtransferase
MKPKKLDICGKTSPYCLSVMAKEAKALKQSGELLITCDNFPAVTTSIPRIAREENLSMDVQKLSKDRWEITLTRE